MAAPKIGRIVEALIEARDSIIERIKGLDAHVRAAAKQNAMARLFMTAPDVGAVTALSVAATYDDASRFPRSSSAGAYLGLTSRRYESGEVSRNGRISKRGNKLTRTHLYEAAKAILTQQTGISSLKAWGLRIAKGAGFKKIAVFTPCGRRTNHSAASSLGHDPRPQYVSLPQMRPCGDVCADEVAPFHAVRWNREHHFGPPVPMQTCGDPCD